MILIFSVITLFYFICFLILSNGFKSYKTFSDARGILTLPYVSAIIAVSDEEIYIENLLDSLSKQNYPSEKIEFIIIDDGSTDNTYNILYEIQYQFLNLLSFDPLHCQLVLHMQLYLV